MIILITAIFINRWLSGYFNPIINWITSFHIYVEFFIFFKKNQIFEFNYIIFCPEPLKHKQIFLQPNIKYAKANFYYGN